MSYGRRGRDGGSGGSSDGASRGHVPGKSSPAQRLSGPRAVQARAAAPLAAGDDRVHALASTVDAPGSEMPHAEVLKIGFGDHAPVIDEIEAHVGGGAADAAAGMGAEAFATGNTVAFRSAPSLHTAAHEAAHVVQQRHGVSDLAGGVGSAGDRHEQHADAVADAIVAGRSAESLLDERAGSAGSAGSAAPAVQRKEESVGARSYVQWQLPNIHAELRTAIARIGMVAYGPYGAHLNRPEYQGSLVEAIRRATSAGWIADGLQRFVAPEPIDDMIDRARGHDWDVSDEDNPKQTSYGPASSTYASPVAVEIANAIARRYIESIRRVFPAFLGAYIELRTMMRSTGFDDTGTVTLAEGWGNVVAVHAMDGAVIHALYDAQQVLPLAEMARQRPDLQEKYEAKHASISDHSMDRPADRPTDIRFKTEDGLFHWLEAVPAGDPVIPGERTATEVARALFRSAGVLGDGAPVEEAYRLIAAPPLWGFHARDIPRFKTEHRDELVARWARTSRSVEWPLDVAQAIDMQVTPLPVAQVDPVAELTGQGPQRALDRALVVAGGQYPAGSKDEASVASRLTEDLKLLDAIGSVLLAVGHGMGAVATAQDRLQGRLAEVTAFDTCIDATSAYALADQQGVVLADVVSGLGEVAVRYATYGGADMPPVIRTLLDDCLSPFVAAITALDYPDLAAPRAAVGTQRVLAFDISVQEASLHSGMPSVDDALHADPPNKDFDAATARVQSNAFAYDLGAMRMNLATNPGQTRTDLAETAPKIGDLEFDISLGDRLLRLDQLWRAIDFEDDFWEGDLDRAEGERLKTRSKALYQRFIDTVKVPFDTAKAADDDDGKKLSRDNFKKLLDEFKPFAIEVRSFIKKTENHKKWSKIITGIAIAVVAFALGQFEFAAILAIEGATVFEAAVVGGIVATTTSVVLEKLILNHDPTVGSLITGFIGNIATFYVVGKLAMAARAAALSAEVSEATIGAARAAEAGEAAAAGAEASGFGARALAAGKQAAHASLALTKEVILGEAIMLVQGEIMSLIDNHRLLTPRELEETLVMGVVNVIGMKVGQHVFDTTIDAFKGARAARGVDIAGLLAEREQLHAMGMRLHETAGGTDHLARGPAPREAAQALLARWDRYFQREHEVVAQLIELGRKHPEAFKAKAAELAELGATAATDAALSLQFRQARALLGIEEVGPNLYRGDPAALDALLAQHRAAGSELRSVTTDPHTGQRTLAIETADGMRIEIVEKLADVGKRRAPEISVGAGRFFEAWLEGLGTAPEAQHIRQRLLEYYARDPKAALELAADRYGFAPGELAETGLIVKPDAPADAGGHGHSSTAVEPSRASRAFDHEMYTRESEPGGMSRFGDERIMNRSDFEAMYRAGYEMDPVTRTWVISKGAAPAAGHLPQVMLERTQVLGQVHSEAVGHELLRRLVSGEAEALRALGIETPPGFDPQASEWALGRTKDGAVVLIQGGKGVVDWSHIPGIEDIAHSHPFKDPKTGEPRLLRGTDGSGTIDIRDLGASALESDLLFLLPSTGDLVFVALGQRGGHRLQTAYSYLGDGKVGNPTPGSAAPPIEFVILPPSAHALLAPGSSVVIWKAELQVWAGDKLVTTTTIYQGHLDTGGFRADMPAVAHNPTWAPIPADHPVHRATAPGATPTTEASAIGHVEKAAAEQLHKTWGLDLADKKVTDALQALSPNDAGALSWLALEAIAGRAKDGFPAWLARFQDPAQRASAMQEVRVARRELGADPAATVAFDVTGTAVLSGSGRVEVPVSAVEHVKGIAGTARKKLLQYEIAPAELDAATERLKAVAQSAGEQAYVAAMKTSALEVPAATAAAIKAAANATNKAIIDRGKAEAEAAAARGAHSAIRTGAIFDAPALDAPTTTQLADYNSTAPTVGVRARQLAAVLPGMRNADFLTFMAAESSQGAVPATPVTIAAPGNLPPGSPATQNMLKWEYPDGTLVRYKPLGDDHRPGTPAFSIEVKKDPTRPDNVPGDVAFKVDAQGAAVPRSDGDLFNPYNQSAQRAAFENAAMEAVHFELIP